MEITSRNHLILFHFVVFFLVTLVLLSKTKYKKIMSAEPDELETVFQLYGLNEQEQDLRSNTLLELHRFCKERGIVMYLNAMKKCLKREEL